MKRILFCLSTILLFCHVALAQMSEQQIVEYLMKEKMKGTSEQEIGMYLSSRGVSPAQLERAKSLFNNEFSKQGTPTSFTQQNRDRNEDLLKDELSSRDFDIISAQIILASTDSSQVFGRKIFNNRNLTFAPKHNIPTPQNYKLGPGDEVIIDIWGASQENIRQTISPDGNITINRVGPIYLNGMTIKEANDYIKRKLSGSYAIDHSDIMLSLGQIRSIKINILGDVSLPGTYTLPSLSSLFHALYVSGGVTNTGSMRSIKLYRNGKLLTTADIYQYLIEGKIDSDIRLADNDVIIVSPYINLVYVYGKVKRPMFYELKEGETLQDLITYAGGFTGDAYQEKIQVTRTTGAENLVHTVLQTQFSNFPLRDRDSVFVQAGFELFKNRVEILGAVYRSGYYELGKEINTVKQLVLAADGLRGDAFLNRAIITREKEDFTTTTLSVDIGNIMTGLRADIPLQKNDILFIPSVNDLVEQGGFTIFGAVTNPGPYKYSENTSLEDLIIQAGGLLESASMMRVDIARRIINPKSVSESDTLSKSFTISIKDGFIIGNEKGFILEPYDQIYIRNSPEYFPQKNIELSGEVLYPGTYALTKKTERLSDVISRAGGVTNHAYLEGARLERQRNPEELHRSEAASRVAQSEKESLNIDTLKKIIYYSIGIELNKALSSPGSDFDLVLREGDRIIIPEYSNTVRINGAVIYPNTVTYRPGQKPSFYVEQAGGYLTNARKRNAYVVYMNGMVSKVRRSDTKLIRPGSELIVPTKDAARRVSPQEIISITTSVASMVSVIALLIRTL